MICQAYECSKPAARGRNFCSRHWLLLPNRMKGYFYGDIHRVQKLFEISVRSAANYLKNYEDPAHE